MAPPLSLYSLLLSLPSSLRHFNRHLTGISGEALRVAAYVNANKAAKVMRAVSLSTLEYGGQDREAFNQQFHEGMVQFEMSRARFVSQLGVTIGAEMLRQDLLLSQKEPYQEGGGSSRSSSSEYPDHNHNHNHAHSSGARGEDLEGWANFSSKCSSTSPSTVQGRALSRGEELLRDSFEREKIEILRANKSEEETDSDAAKMEAPRAMDRVKPGISIYLAFHEHMHLTRHFEDVIVRFVDEMHRGSSTSSSDQTGLIASGYLHSDRLLSPWLRAARSLCPGMWVAPSGNEADPHPEARFVCILNMSIYGIRSFNMSIYVLIHSVCPYMVIIPSFLALIRQDSSGAARKVECPSECVCV